MKSRDSVKPLRAVFSTNLSSDQKVSVMCDTRWSHRPLYQFVLDTNLPAAEKLVLLSVASYREPGAHKYVHFGTIQPNVNDIQKDTNLPATVVTKILRVLYDAGYLTIDGMYGRSETFIVEQSLPMFGEYFSLSKILDCANEAETSEISARLNVISIEIRDSLELATKPLEHIAKLYPGLYRTHIHPWLRIEDERPIKSAASEGVSMP